MSSLQKAKHSRVKVGSEIEFRDAQFRSQQVNTENNDKVTLSLWKDNDPNGLESTGTDGRAAGEYYLNISQTGGNSVGSKILQNQGVFLHGVKNPSRQLDAANKQYVDTMVTTGVGIKESCHYGTWRKIKHGYTDGAGNRTIISTNEGKSGNKLSGWWDQSGAIFPVVKTDWKDFTTLHATNDSWTKDASFVDHSNNILDSAIDYCSTFPRNQGGGTFRDICQNDITCSIRGNLATWGWELEPQENWVPYIMGWELRAFLDIPSNKKVYHKDRILVRHQQDPAENGIYEVNIGFPYVDQSISGDYLNFVYNDVTNNLLVGGINRGMEDFSYNRLPFALDNGTTEAVAWGGNATNPKKYKYFLVRANDYNTAFGGGNGMDDKLSGAYTFVRDGRNSTSAFSQSDAKYSQITLQSDWIFEKGDFIRDVSNGAVGRVVINSKDVEGIDDMSKNVLVHMVDGKFTNDNVSYLDVKSSDNTGWKKMTEDYIDVPLSHILEFDAYDLGSDGNNHKRTTGNEQKYKDISDNHENRYKLPVATKVTFTEKKLNNKEGTDAELVDTSATLLAHKKVFKGFTEAEWDPEGGNPLRIRYLTGDITQSISGNHEAYTVKIEVPSSYKNKMTRWHGMGAIPSLYMKDMSGSEFNVVKQSALFNKASDISSADFTDSISGTFGGTAYGWQPTNPPASNYVINHVNSNYGSKKINILEITNDYVAHNATKNFGFYEPFTVKKDTSNDVGIASTHWESLTTANDDMFMTGEINSGDFVKVDFEGVYFQDASDIVLAAYTGGDVSFINHGGINILDASGTLDVDHLKLGVNQSDISVCVGTKTGDRNYTFHATGGYDVSHGLALTAGDTSNIVIIYKNSDNPSAVPSDDTNPSNLFKHYIVFNNKIEGAFTFQNLVDTSEVLIATGSDSIANRSVKKNSQGNAYVTLSDNARNTSQPIYDDSGGEQTSFNKGYGFVAQLKDGTGEVAQKIKMNANGYFFGDKPTNLSSFTGNLSEASNGSEWNSTTKYRDNKVKVVWNEFSNVGSGQFSFDTEDSGLIQEGEVIRIDPNRRAIFDEDGADSGQADSVKQNNYGVVVGDTYYPSIIGGHTEIGSRRLDARVQIGRDHRTVNNNGLTGAPDACGNSNYSSEIHMFGNDINLNAGMAGVNIKTLDTDDRQGGSSGNNKADVSDNTGTISLMSGSGGNQKDEGWSAGKAAGIELTTGSGGQGNAKDTSGGMGGKIALNTGVGGNTTVSGNAGAGGDFELTTGAGGSVIGGTGEGSTGGMITLTTGKGGDNSGNNKAGSHGGNIEIVTGAGGNFNGALDSSAGKGGDFTITLGNAGSITEGMGYGNGDVGGAFNLTTGNGSTAWVGNDMTSSTDTSGLGKSGGDIELKTGKGGNTIGKLNSENMSGGTGGNIQMTTESGGDVSGSGSGGDAGKIILGEAGHGTGGLTDSSGSGGTGTSLEVNLGKGGGALNESAGSKNTFGGVGGGVVVNTGEGGAGGRGVLGQDNVDSGVLYKYKNHENIKTTGFKDVSGDGGSYVINLGDGGNAQHDGHYGGQAGTFCISGGAGGNSDDPTTRPGSGSNIVLLGGAAGKQLTLAAHNDSQYNGLKVTDASRNMNLDESWGGDIIMRAGDGTATQKNRNAGTVQIESDRALGYQNVEILLETNNTVFFNNQGHLLFNSRSDISAIINDQGGGGIKQAGYTSSIPAIETFLNNLPIDVVTYASVANGGISGGNDDELNTAKTITVAQSGPNTFEISGNFPTITKDTVGLKIYAGVNPFVKVENDWRELVTPFGESDAVLVPTPNGANPTLSGEVGYVGSGIAAKSGLHIEYPGIFTEPQGNGAEIIEISGGLLPGIGIAHADISLAMSANPDRDGAWEVVAPGHVFKITDDKPYLKLYHNAGDGAQADANAVVDTSYIIFRNLNVDINDIDRNDNARFIRLVAPSKLYFRPGDITKIVGPLYGGNPNITLKDTGTPEATEKSFTYTDISSTLRIHGEVELSDISLYTHNVTHVPGTGRPAGATYTPGGDFATDGSFIYLYKEPTVYFTDLSLIKLSGDISAGGVETHEIFGYTYHEKFSNNAADPDTSFVDIYAIKGDINNTAQNELGHTNADISLAIWEGAGAPSNNANLLETGWEYISNTALKAYPVQQTVTDISYLALYQSTGSTWDGTKTVASDISNFLVFKNHRENGGVVFDNSNHAAVVIQNKPYNANVPQSVSGVIEGIINTGVLTDVSLDLYEVRGNWTDATYTDLKFQVTSTLRDHGHNNPDFGKLSFTNPPSLNNNEWIKVYDMCNNNQDDGHKSITFRNAYYPEPFGNGISGATSDSILSDINENSSSEFVMRFRLPSYVDHKFAYNGGNGHNYIDINLKAKQHDVLKESYAKQIDSVLTSAYSLTKTQLLVDLSLNFIDLSGSEIAGWCTRGNYESPGTNPKNGGWNDTGTGGVGYVHNNTFVNNVDNRFIDRRSGLTDYSIFLNAKDSGGGGVVKVRATRHVQMASDRMHFTSVDVSMNEAEREDDAQDRPWDTETKKGVFFDLKQGLIECTEIVTTSDEFYKTNIVAVTDATDKIAQLKGVYFDWKSAEIGTTGEYDQERHQLGFIAQQVEKVVPEVVKRGDRGTRAIAYDKLTALLVEGIKEQQDAIDKINKDLEKAKRFEKQVVDSSDSEDETVSDTNSKKIDNIQEKVDEMNDYCIKLGQNVTKPSKKAGNNKRIESLENQVGDLSDKMDQVLSFLEQLNNMED